MVELKNNYLKKANKIHDGKYEYISIVKPNIVLKIKCPKHGIFYQKYYNHIYRKNGCIKCANKKLNISDFINRANKLHNNKYIYTNSIYNGRKEKIKIICPIHGEFECYAENHIGINISGCPKCKSSKGELMIKNILIKNKIRFTEQKKFKDLISPFSKRPLTFDFYLVDLNICIEYDGIQHFKKFKSFGGGDIGFKKQQIRDLSKDQYCEQNNIGLIRFDYKNNIRIINENRS